VQNTARKFLYVGKAERVLSKVESTQKSQGSKCLWLPNIDERSQRIIQEYQVEQTENLTRSQKKKQQRAARTANGKQINNSLKLRRITAQTSTQQVFFDCYDKFDVLSLHGYPGTGKTFLALYSALGELEDDERYEIVRIIRSGVSVRDIGFLPGSAKEKMSAFEAPYVAICSELYGRADAYEILKNKKQVEFSATSHMRGVTFRKSIVIIDECQNMSYQELNTILTRIGEDCKVILCGDIYQDDLTSERYNESSGYKDVLQILDRVNTCRMIDFKIHDIVRSGFVKDFIIAKVDYEAGKPKKPKPMRFDALIKSVSNSTAD